MAGRPKGVLNQKTIAAQEQAKSHTPRCCLKCRQMFPSSGPGNRLCWTCNHENEKTYDQVRYRDPQE